ncbi:MAG: ferritin-like domain-containing protein [Candidatus Methylomirabilales bacterium]
MVTGGKAKGGWRRLFADLTTNQRERLLAILEEQAQEEGVEAGRLRGDAEGLRHLPEKRQQLLAIAERESEHVRLLRAQIQALGGTPPGPRSPSPRKEQTLWERLVGDLEAEKEDLNAFLHAAHAAEETDPDVAALLLRIRDEEEANRRALMELLAKSDPYAIG